MGRKPTLDECRRFMNGLIETSRRIGAKDLADEGRRIVKRYDPLAAVESPTLDDIFEDMSRDTRRKAD